MPLSTADIQSQLDNWLAASAAVAAGQAYSIGDRSLTRANSEDIRRQIDYWSAQLAIAERREQGNPQANVVLAGWRS